MLFEKSLNQPLTNWNMNCDKFLFQERNKGPVFLVKLYDDEQAQVFKFKLPMNNITRTSMADASAIHDSPAMEEFKNIQEDS